MYLAKDILGVFISLVVRCVRAEALPFPRELFLGLNLMSFQPYFLSHNPLILLLDQPRLDIQLVLPLIMKAGMNPYRIRRDRLPTKEKVGMKPIFQIEEMMRMIILLGIIILQAEVDLLSIIHQVVEVFLLALLGVVLRVEVPLVEVLLVVVLQAVPRQVRVACFQFPLTTTLHNSFSKFSLGLTKLLLP